MTGTVKLKIKIFLFTLLLGNNLAVSAHHSFSAHFYPDKVVEITGTVKKFYWSNPHAFIFLNVVNEAGETVEYRLEMANTIALTHRGWNKNSVAAGDVLHVKGNPARVESRHMIHVKSLKRESDGFELKEQPRQ